ncbi:unnamed protein product [Prorocentrum cordatum]|uniref:Uncharacterized protein n=1 Tax=Prorocentrum cordatum TaxID=2364126 RepID=A0ABN9S6B1_9DINO|nr:unnamed protein product [Polarella glacialis]
MPRSAFWGTAPLGARSRAPQGPNPRAAPSTANAENFCPRARTAWETDAPGYPGGRGYESQRVSGLGVGVCTPASGKVVPYGVLGTQLRRDRSVVAVACAPDQLTAVLDSAGHHVVKAGGPKAAAGAARATYKWAGIDADDAYAADVVAAVRRAGTAKHYSYAGRQVIHVFGPDLRGLEAGHAAEAQEGKKAHRQNSSSIPPKIWESRGSRGEDRDPEDMGKYGECCYLCLFIRVSQGPFRGPGAAGGGLPRRAGRVRRLGAACAEAAADLGGHSVRAVRRPHAAARRGGEACSEGQGGT